MVPLGLFELTRHNLELCFPQSTIEITLPKGKGGVFGMITRHLGGGVDMNTDRYVTFKKKVPIIIYNWGRTLGTYLGGVLLRVVKPKAYFNKGTGNQFVAGGGQSE